MVNLQILSDASIPLRDSAKQLLSPLIGPFKATTAPIVGNDGHSTESYSVVVHQCEHEPSKAVPIDSVAAVIDCCDVLTLEALRAAYERIGRLKSIRKTDRPGPADGDHHMTTSFIVARNADMTLEQISQEMGRLNTALPSHRWPDAVAVLSMGMINYSAHAPASERSGDFFLPAEPVAARSPVPSVYVHKIIRATGELTFNKVASLVMMRVWIFQPGIKIPDYRELTKEVPSYGAAADTYQFNLANTLVPMTREQAIAARLPQDTFNIVDGKKALGSVQFQSWQDGGVFIVRGAFPMDLFLIFLKGVVPGLSHADMQYFRGSGLQVSYVLPMNERQFLETLSFFDRRSANMSIQREASKILIQKVGDEGSTSPFFARMMLGVIGLREAVYADPAERNDFDELYDPVLTGLRSARETSRDIDKEWKEHQSRIESGAAVVMDGRRVHINEHIDRSLRRDLESFLNTAVRTIKHCLQDLTKHMGTDIGFLFQKNSAFEQGLAQLRMSAPELADYLRATRQWSEPLVLTRNDLEHGAIPSPKVSYILDSSPVRAEEPKFAGKPITEFTNGVLDRICCFAEEMIVSCLRKRLPKSFEITEVPLSERDPNAPERFRMTVTPGGSHPWVLGAHTRKFEEC